MARTAPTIDVATGNTGTTKVSTSSSKAPTTDFYGDVVNFVTSPIQETGKYLSKGLQAGTDVLFGKPRKTMQERIEELDSPIAKAPQKQFDAEYIKSVSENVNANKFADDIEKSGEPNAKKIAEGVRERNKQWFNLPVSERKEIREFDKSVNEEKNLQNLEAFNAEQEKLTNEIWQEEERLKNTVSGVGSRKDFQKLNLLNNRLNELKVKKNALELKPEIFKSNIFKDDNEILDNLGPEMNEVLTSLREDNPSKYERFSKQFNSSWSNISSKEKKELITEALNVKQRNLENGVAQAKASGELDMVKAYGKEVDKFNEAVKNGDETTATAQQSLLQSYKEAGVDNVIEKLKGLSKQEEDIADVVETSAIKYDIFEDEIKQAEVDKFVEDNLILGRAWEFAKSAYSILPKTVKSGIGIGEAIGNTLSGDSESGIKNVGVQKFKELVDGFSPTQAKLGILKGENNDIDWKNLVNFTGNQIATMAVLLQGGGTVGNILKGIGAPAKIAQSVGLMASSYAISKDDYYNHAVSQGMKSKDATLFANQSAGLTSLLELISPNDMILTGKIKSEITKDFAKYFTKGGLKYALGQSAKRIAKETLGKELPQEVSQLLGDKFLQLAYNRTDGTKFNENIDHKELKETVIGTLAATSVLTALRNSQVNKQEKQQYLYEASKDLNVLQETLKGMKLSESDVAKVMEQITPYNKAHNAMPQDLDEDTKKNVAPLLVAKDKLQQQANAENLDPAFKTAINERIKVIDNTIVGLVNGKFDPNKVVISDDPIEAVKNTEEAIKEGTNVIKEEGLEEGKEKLDAFENETPQETKPVETIKVESEVITPKEEAEQVDDVQEEVNSRRKQAEIKYKDKTDDDLENRYTELDSKDKLTEAERREFNDIENEQEAREWRGVMNVSTEQAKAKLKALKGSKARFIEARDIRESNETIERYDDAQSLTDTQVKSDFKNALFGNPTTWYADGLKLKLSVQESLNRGITPEQLIENAEAEFIKDGYSKKTAKETVAMMLNPVLKNNKQTQSNSSVNNQIVQVEPPVKSYGYEDIDAMVDEQQVAKELNQEIIDPTELTPVQQAIRQFGGVTTTEESYAQFGDKNNLSKEARKTSIRKNAQSLDALAEEISSKGLTVTPADLVDYIDTFAEGDNKLSNRAEALKEKMFDLTGKKFNKYTISKYVDKINAKARERFLAEMDAPSLSPEEIGIIEQNGINTENIDDIAQKLDWLYEPETFENIKAYLKNENKRESGSSDESGKSTERVSEKSDGVEKQPKAGDSARNFANKIREGKINKLGGFRAGTGFDAAWDLGIEAVALSIEGGAKIADAIQSGLEAIKKTDWYKGLEDKANFDKQYNDHMQKEYEVESTNDTKEESKSEQKSSGNADFDELANRRLPTRETRETKSNVERESGDILSADIKEFEGVDFKQSMLHGDNVIENAKIVFGDSYVTDLLNYIKESKMPFENKAVILVSLENNLRKQLLENPKDTRLKKQIDVATKASVEHLRSGATAAAVGIFRQAARANYETQLAAESIFSPKERESRTKVESAVFSTPEDIQVEYEQREQDIDKAIAEGVEKKIEEIYSTMSTARRQKADKAIAALDKIQKRLRSKTYDASIGVPVAIIDAGISTIKAAIRAGVSIADAIEAGIRKIKQEHGQKWDKEDDFRKDMLDGFSSEGVNAATDVSSSLKDELIDAGYGKEITVTTKDGKEKRMVYDWKKLLGIEGSFENLKDAIDKSMKGKGYTQSEIDAFQQQLQDEYNDIHADIIEKSVNELNRRNAPKEGDTKPLARRLAELYNLGLYEQDVDAYSNILNNILGISPASQQAFNEIRDFNRSLAKLLETKDAKGNLLSDVALASAETQVKNHIKRVIEKVQFAEGSMYFKASVVLKNLFSAMQRMMLAKISQLVENPFSGKINDIHVQLQDAFKKGKWDNKELAKYRSMLSTAMFDDIVRKGGDEYGGVGNPFTSKNTIESFINGLSKNSLYQAFVSAMSGRVYLDAADSYFKVKRTEKEFTHNLIRILTSPTNPNGAMSQEDALKYVSEAVTGQKFEDAKELARTIISDVNKDAGKEILRPSETNVIRLANDIVKDNLVNGEAMTIKQVENAFKAGYKTSGKSIGHESNNFITDVINKTNEVIQTKLNEALKRKDWSAAATLNLTSILSKNIISPFVGGGTNWTVIGLQKMGLPTEWLRSDVGFSEKPLDLSTKEGLKESEKSLYANATRQRMNGRIVASTFTALAAILAMRALGDEDDYKKWLKKHPDTRKIINKIQPVPLTLYLAREDGTDFVRAALDALGSRQNFDQMKFERASKEFYKGVSNDDDKAMKKAWGAMGELVGRKFMVPYLSSISNYGDVEKKVYAEFKGTPLKTDYKASKGFVQGFYKNGLMAYLGLMPEISPDKPLTLSERERMREESRSKRGKSRN